MTPRLGNILLDLYCSAYVPTRRTVRHAAGEHDQEGQQREHVRHTRQRRIPSVAAAIVVVTAILAALPLYFMP